MIKKILKFKKDFLFNSLYFERLQKRLVLNKKLYKGGFNLKLLKLLFNFKKANKFNLRSLVYWKVVYLFFLLVNYISPYNSIKTFSWFIKRRKKKIKKSKHTPKILSFKKKNSISTLWFKLELKNSINLNLKSKIESELFRIFTFKSKIFLTRFRHSILVKSLAFSNDNNNKKLTSQDRKNQIANNYWRSNLLKSCSGHFSVNQQKGITIKNNFKKNQTL